MKWADNIKTQYGLRILARRLKQQKRLLTVCNVEEAMHIGIIYNATEYVSFEIIRTLVKELSRDNRKVTVLGFVNSKKLIDHYLYRKGFDFFSKKELNWYFRPVSSAVEQFMTETFDLLINLSLEDNYPIRYITALSPAKFKAGRFSPDDTHLDFMIDIEKEKQTMKNLKKEIMKEADQKHDITEIEADVEKKTETELQLSFLIDQLMHYLSILKK